MIKTQEKANTRKSQIIEKADFFSVLCLHKEAAEINM